MPEEILRVEKLKKHFPVKNDHLLPTEKAVLKAVDGVSFSIHKGEIFGLVGESGCGKSTLGRTILKLYEPTKGRIFFEGEDITDKTPKQMVPIRARMQMIFQDPYASLDPRMTVGDIIREPMVIAKDGTKAEQLERVQELLERVGLKPDHIRRYPHEFSGGQRQRIGIARALALEPEFIVCDEPVSALDVSIQAQILNLMQDLQEQRELTYMFVTHDLSVVKHIANRIIVMYLGQIVEMADTEELFANPLHPYTQALLSAVPVPDIRVKRKRILLKGEITSPIDPAPGCRFCPRCPMGKDVCRCGNMGLKEVSKGHFISCCCI